MRAAGKLLLVAATLLGPPARPAMAATLPFEGHLTFKIGTLPRLRTASKVAMAAITLGPSGLSGFSLAEGLVGGPPVSVAIPSSYGLAPLSGVQVTASNGAGVFARASAGAPLEGMMPLRGFAKACLFGACAQMPLANVNIPLGVIGVGGTTTATAAVNVTVRGAPWTTGSTGISTGVSGGGVDAGSVHTTAGGAIDLNLVTPVFIHTNLPAMRETFAFAHLVLHLAEDVCSNGLDDDGDGATDFPDDPGCTAAQDPSEHAPGLPCDDGADGDHDRVADVDDPGCTSPSDPSEHEEGLACDDEVDNDGDGRADLADAGCDGPDDESERIAGRVCDDDVDADGDGAAAYPDDPGCSSVADDWESRDFTTTSAGNIVRVLDAENGVIDDDVQIRGAAQQATRWRILEGTAITRDLNLLLQLDVVIEGGGVGGDLIIDPTVVPGPGGYSGFSLVRINGGSVSGDVIVASTAVVVVRGGTLEGTLVLNDTSVVQIFGTPTEGLPGPVLEESGVLEGTFPDGTPYSIPFTREPDAQLTVPEAGAAAGAVIAWLLLLLARARR